MRTRVTILCEDLMEHVEHSRGICAKTTCEQVKRNAFDEACVLARYMPLAFTLFISHQDLKKNSYLGL